MDLKNKIKESSSLESLANAYPVLKLGQLFCHGMIFQRGKKVPVWGWSSPNALVRLSFGGQNCEVYATGEGYWRAYFEPMEASKVGQRLSVESVGESVWVEDVLIGEVWICSGQSNMEMTVKEAARSVEFIRDSEDLYLREFGVERAPAIIPQTEVKGRWRYSCPEHVGDFTAVGYHFARRLRCELDIPVGLIKSSWGGSSIEAWMSERSLLESEAFDEVYLWWSEMMANYPRDKRAFLATEKEWEIRNDAAKAAGKPFSEPFPWPPLGPSFSQMPTTLFNGMIAPLAPYAAQGFLWYQGETNVKKPALYRKEFAALIRDWRKYWEDEKMAFYFVQLASFIYESEARGLDWAYLRQAQEDTLEVSDTGMVVSIDLVDDLMDIHPVNKHDLGVRLSALALQRNYGMEDLQASGPKPTQVSVEQSKVVIKFSREGGALVIKESETCPFEISGDGINFIPAKIGSLDDYTIECWAEAVQKPKAIRYACYNAPIPTLFDQAGWPVAPFSLQCF